MRLRRATHKTIAGVTDDIENFRFNRAVARIYEFANSLDELAPGADPAARRETLEIAGPPAGADDAASGRGAVAASGP